MKVLLVATVQSHICQFHKPLVAMQSMWQRGTTLPRRTA